MKIIKRKSSRIVVVGLILSVGLTSLSVHAASREDVVVGVLAGAVLGYAISEQQGDVYVTHRHRGDSKHHSKYHSKHYPKHYPHRSHGWHEEAYEHRRPPNKHYYYGDQRHPFKRPHYDGHRHSDRHCLHKSHRHTNKHAYDQRQKHKTRAQHYAESRFRY